jgi:midasin (ATPase involved in ribosome maturation)
MTTANNMIAELSSQYGSTVTRKQLIEYSENATVSLATICKRLEPYKCGRGVYNLTVSEAREQLEKQMQTGTIQVPAREEINLIPDKDDHFVPFGNFTDVKKIIKSGIFYPTFITGLSGNGKTVSVEQSCAQLKRELIRVNITIETDEDDLIGGFRLVDGETVWHNGPVVDALERGAILLLDEVDLASNKILCLQSVLEGKGVFLKKIGKYVKPAAGFNVIATANTKGKGSDDGRFIGTNVLNEAFLERFALTFEQDYPTPSVETKILNNYCSELNCCNDKFITALVTWAEIIRKTFIEGGIDEVVSTRRLVHIIRAYSIFGDDMKAISVCLNRFDDDTKQSFLDLYDKIVAPDETETQA